MGDRFNHIDPIANPTGGNDILKGGASSDQLFGDAGNDTLNGGAGNDTITRGAGNDTINYTVGDGVDTIDGGTDTDTLAVSGTSGDDSIEVVLNGSGVVTSIEGTTPTNVESFKPRRPRQWRGRRHARLHRLRQRGDGQSRHDSAAGFTSAANIENVTGTGFGDLLTGTGGDNVVTGGAGNDIIDGGSGSDTAVFSGLRSQYRVTLNPNGSVHVLDLRGGRPDGTDTVSNVEFLQFSDMTINASTVVDHTPVVMVPNPSVQAAAGQTLQMSTLVSAHGCRQRRAGLSVL